MFKKLFRLFKPSKIKIGGGEDKVIVLDFRDKTLVLPNGDIIKKEDILNYDPKTGILVYRTPLGEVKQLKIGGEGATPEDVSVSSLLEALSGRSGAEARESTAEAEKEEKNVIHI